MQTSQQNNKRIAKNTLLLYVRTFVTLLISLYTSRLVLNALGVEDFGIYNIVGGVVASFTFLNTTMASATQRFLTYELGKKNFTALKMVFANSKSIHLLLSVLVLLLAETFGLWFTNNMLTLPTNRIFAANIVFQCAIGTFIVNILSVPYNALIIAHEKMSAFAYISILEVLIKLIISLTTVYALFDKLIIYATLWLIGSIIVRIVYSQYCVKHFEESKSKPSINKKCFSAMLGFSSINLCEIFANMLSNHGVNILLNIHFGPSVNAARGIANQVGNALNSFTNNFTMALKPQITKNYAAKNTDAMLSLVSNGNRFSFYLLMLMGLPVFFKADYILELWLKIPPSISCIFLRLLILTNLCKMLTNTFYTAISATGKIKKYQSVFAFFRFMVFPACWLSLSLGTDPTVVYYVTLGFEIFGTAVKLHLLQCQIEFHVWQYCKETIIPCVIVFIVSMMASFVLKMFFPNTIEGLLFFVLTDCLAILLFILVLGLKPSERKLCTQFASTSLKRMI